MKLAPLDLTSNIIDYENGDMEDQDIPEFFQKLIDTGLAWQLQGCYGRTATALINAGECSPPADPEMEKED